jgi:Zn-dependent protease/CBS domain-containing protein
VREEAHRRIREPGRTMNAGVRIIRIAGIDVVLDWSVAVVVALVVVTLGAGVFPLWHPGWPAWLDFVVAASAALLLLGSILLHELSHALVGRARGVSFERITLFIFGGMAQLQREPRRWSAELLMAVAGPITSIAIGALFLWIANATAPVMRPAAGQDPLALLAALGPGSTLALWVGQINVLLAAFNLIPGFPLDGGRVLRAVLWGATGNLRKATRYAAAAGRFFAVLLVGTGIAMAIGIYVPYVGTGVLAGLWVILIGWFLHNAAMANYRQLVIRTSLERVPVARLMQSRVDTAGEDTTLQELVDGHVLGGVQRAFPVMHGDDFAGIVCLKDIRSVPRSQWERTTVRGIMTPASSVHTVMPAENAAEAMLELGRGGFNQLPVVERGKLRGLLTREDVLRLLTIYGDPALAS